LDITAIFDWGSSKADYHFDRVFIKMFVRARICEILQVYGGIRMKLTNFLNGGAIKRAIKNKFLRVKLQAYPQVVTDCLWGHKQWK